jgi:hypothetical protein
MVMVAVSLYVPALCDFRAEISRLEGGLTKQEGSPLAVEVAVRSGA